MLRALALERMGQRGEALALLKKVQQQQPTEADVLSSMLIVYKCADVGISFFFFFSSPLLPLSPPIRLFFSIPSVFLQSLPLVSVTRLHSLFAGLVVMITPRLFALRV